MTRILRWIFLGLALAMAGQSALADDAKIVLIAGRPSHGKGEHEFNAGMKLLVKCLKETPGINPIFVGGGWPSDESVFDGARAVVFFMDGGGGHPIIQGDHLAKVKAMMARGVGLACMHYAVEIPKDKGGPEFLDWIGGYYEAGYSTNPHWTADVKSLPEHPITRGVKPFALVDEWYYTCPFRRRRSHRRLHGQRRCVRRRDRRFRAGLRRTERTRLADVPRRDQIRLDRGCGVIDAAVFKQAATLLDRCRARGLRLATAESCTGGLIAATLTAIAGSSDVLDRGFVTYSNMAKAEMLGVPVDLIARAGAVSEEVAAAMADGALARSSAELAIAVTGVAGPGGGSAAKPVGLVWFGLAQRDGQARTERHVFPGDRERVRAETVARALAMLAETVG